MRPFEADRRVYIVGRRAPHERGRRRRAAQGSRGAAAVRGHRPRRGRARAAARDDPLALPARSVQAALPRRGEDASRGARPARRGAGDRGPRGRRAARPRRAAARLRSAGERRVRRPRSRARGLPRRHVRAGEGGADRRRARSRPCAPRCARRSSRPPRRRRRSASEETKRDLEQRAEARRARGRARRGAPRDRRARLVVSRSRRGGRGRRGRRARTPTGWRSSPRTRPR